MKNIIIIIPALDNTSPIKGAISYANNLSSDFNVHIISLFKIQNYENIKRDINIYDFSKYKNFFLKVICINKFIKFNQLNDKNCLVISFCLYADFVNAFITKNIKKISSIRGNYEQNYKIRFGLPGVVLAFFHKKILKQIKNIIVMNSFMKKKYSKKSYNIFHINNFIEENNISFTKKLNQNNDLNILFIGNLNKNKKILLLLENIIILINKQYKINFTILGEGHLKNKINSTIKNYNLNSKIKNLGFIKKPFDMIYQSDVLILPSLFEGTSRAILESLFIGTPCILRNTNDNFNLISNSENSLLFDNDEDLIKKIIFFYENFNNNDKKTKNCLLPNSFRENNCVNILIKVVNNLLNEK